MKRAGSTGDLRRPWVGLLGVWLIQFTSNVISTAHAYFPMLLSLSSKVAPIMYYIQENSYITWDV
jgi:hypothetical protein